MLSIYKIQRQENKNMSLFNIILSKIQCSIFQGASIELYEYCEELKAEFDFVEKAYNNTIAKKPQKNQAELR